MKCVEITQISLYFQVPFAYTQLTELSRGRLGGTDTLLLEGKVVSLSRVAEPDLGYLLFGYSRSRHFGPSPAPG